MHRTIKAVTNDLEQLSFNTAIARMMEFTNFFLKEEVRPKTAMQRFVLLLSPFAPHLAEELWQALHSPLSRSGRGAGGEGSTSSESTLAYQPWPIFDESAIREDTIEIPVQINGKLRWRIQVPAGIDQPSLEAAARGDAKVAELLAGKTVVKAIVVPGRLVNFVVK